MADDLPEGFSLTPPAAQVPPKLKGLDAIRGYFQNKGNFLNPHAADALAATSFAETGGDPYAVNKSSKAAAAFQWLGPRKEAFLAQGDTTPEGMAKFAMSELPKYPRSWAALNDPNMSRDDVQKVLIDEFEAPGGSAAAGYGEAAGDLSRARAYVPPKPGDVQKSALPPPAKPQGLPPGFSASPPKSNLPPGFSTQAPGAVDPEIAARSKPPEDDSYFAPEKKVAKMLMADPTGTLKKLGGAAVQMGKGALNDLGVFGDVAQGKASMADSETQKRVMGAALLTGGKEAPGELSVKPLAKPAETLPAAKAIEAAPEIKKAVGDGVLGQSVTEAGPPPNEASIAARAPKPELAVDNAAQPAGAAKTPLHELAAQNIKDFEAANPDPTLKQKLTAASDYAKSYFETGGKAKAIIQKNVGNMARMGAQAKEAMTKFGQFTKSLNPEEQLSLIKWLQKPGAMIEKGFGLPPEAQEFANTFKEWMQKYRQKLETLPQTDQMSFRENFVTQLWRHPESAMKTINELGAKKGSNYFTKARVFDDYEAGIRAGMAPVTTDPMELFSRYIENASAKIASWESKNDAKDAGMIVYRKPENAPQGWVPLKGERDAFGHDAYAPPGLAAVFNNYASIPAKLNIPGTHVDVLDIAQKAANRTTSFKLAISGFHAALETMESVLSGLSDGITKLKNGRPIAGITAIAKAPGKPLTAFVKGRRAQKAFLDGEFGDPEMQKIVQGLTDANYDFMREGGLADEYRVSKLPGFIKGWQKGIPATAGGPLKMGIRAFETTMEPVFQYYVPWLKNQAAMDAMKTYLDAHPDISREDFAAYGRKVANTMDARFGEMNSKNIFWNATAKKMAQTAAISWSFTLGQARQAMGAAFDAARIPDKLYSRAKGTLPSTEEIWTDRLSYAVAIGLGTAMVNSVYQYLKTGQLPQSGQDLLNPRTGGVDPSTKEPERATLPNFANSYRNIWEGGVGQEAYNKLAPLWQTLIEAGENKDWKSQPIYNPNDTTTKQIEQLGEFVAGNTLTPITLGQVSNVKAGSHISSLERIFGIRAAGMRDTAPDQLKGIISYKQAEAWYDKRRSDVNAQRAKQGLGPLRISHREKQQLINTYMKNPQADPLQKYGGTQ